MKITLKRLALAIASAGLLTIYGCGGGGGSGVGSTPPVAQITGTAATGAALANAPVTIMNSAGNSPCVETSITTTELGSYTCTLKSGESAPFFIKITDPTGNTAPLVSIATQTPAAGTPLTVNATPLTTAIVAQLNNGDALGVFDSRTFVAADLATVTANVLAQLAPVLTAIGTPAGYDPFTTSITAATSANTGNTADQVLDMVKIGTDPSTGTLAFSTITDPTPVPLASATSTGTTVATPTASASDLGQAAQVAAAAFANCFALPPAQRALTTDTTIPAANGGPTVTSVAPECDNIVTNGTIPSGSPAFLHNGYSSGQFFYGLLTSSSMTGAKFSVPEIMAFYPADVNNTYDRAILNMRYVDNAGNPGNVITVAANIPGTSSTTRPTNWWLVGNQSAVNFVFRNNIRRVEQMKAGYAGTGNVSGFHSGFSLLMYTNGPGSLYNGNQLNLARIKGPGLPTAGMVLKNYGGAYNYMDIYNKTGSLTVGTQCGGTGATNCPNLWLTRTNGLTSSSLLANPTHAVWAQSGEGYDASQFKKGAVYTLELFYGSNTTTADRTVRRPLLTDMIQATAAVNMNWNSLGTQSNAALDPAGSLAGAQTALPMDWTQNPSAEQIGSIAASVAGRGVSASKGIPKGATSGVMDTATVPAFSATDTTTFRSLLFNYRMLDSSYKSAFYYYN